MDRQQEINEFANALQALCKSYQVTLGVTIQDLKPKTNENDPAGVSNEVSGTNKEEAGSDDKKE